MRELLESAETEEDIDAAVAPLDEVESKTAETSGRDPSATRWCAETLSEVADFFKLALSTVKQSSQESNPMPGRRGNWPLAEIVRWWHERLVSNDLTREKKRMDLELSQVVVEQERLALARWKGELVERADVERWAAMAIVALHDGVPQLPVMLAAAAPESLKNFVRGEKDRHCRELLHASATRLVVTETRNACARDVDDQVSEEHRRNSPSRTGSHVDD